MVNSCMKAIVCKTLLTVALLCNFGYGVLLHAQPHWREWYLSSKVSFADYSATDLHAGYSSSKVPPFHLQLDYALMRNITVGGFIGADRMKYTNDTLPSEVQKEMTIGVGVQGSYHFAEALERWMDYAWDLTNFDFYVSLALRLEFWSDDHRDKLQVDGVSRTDIKKDGTRLRGGPALGMRYYLNDHFAMFLEGGYASMGVVSMGVTWNL